MAYGCQTPSAQRRSDQNVPQIVATLVCSAGARNTLGPIVNQIMGKLRGTVYGPFYFEVGLILREAMLVNAEAWYGMV